MGKRYWWLKLQEDFFRQVEIKKLRKIAGGDTYTVIYLKMMLLSLKNEGHIAYDCPESEFIENLALDIDEDEENVSVTVAFLRKHNLLVESEFESDVSLPKAAEAIGSETAVAERVRRHREKIKALQCNTSVTASNKCNELCHGEIEVDIELEKELKKEKELDAEVEKEKKKNSIFKLCKEKEIELSTNAEEYISNCLNNGMTPEIIVYAISESVDHQVKNWSYVQKILERYKFERYTTVEEVKRDSMERNQSNLPTYTKKFYNQFYAN